MQCKKANKPMRTQAFDSGHRNSGGGERFFYIQREELWQ